MKNLFERTSSTWVRYSEYEWKKSEDGILYLTPSKTAQPSIYDPLTEYQQIVLDAINIGRMGTLWTTKRCTYRRIILSKRKPWQRRTI